MSRISCDSCQLVAIQGLVCHETGCRNSHINPRTGKLYRKDCRCCGKEFTPKYDGQDVCSIRCRKEFWGH